MTNGELRRAESDDTNEEFIMPNIDAVSEDNWQGLVEQGVSVLDDCVSPEELLSALRFAQSRWGTAFVLTGDPFDPEEQRPLHLKPGRGIYVLPEGLAYHERLEEEERQRHQ